MELKKTTKTHIFTTVGSFFTRGSKKADVEKQPEIEYPSFPAPDFLETKQPKTVFGAFYIFLLEADPKNSKPKAFFKTVFLFIAFSFAILAAWIFIKLYLEKKFKKKSNNNNTEPAPTTPPDTQSNNSSNVAAKIVETAIDITIESIN